MTPSVALLSLVLSQALPPFNGVSRGEWATTGALGLFVETTGNDGSDCRSVGAPCATLQGAFDKIPENVFHGVTITAGLGNFSGAVLSGKVIHTRSGGGAWINFQGTLKTATVATGTASGTLTGYVAGAAATHTTYTDSTQSWTANDLRGKWVQITGGTGVSATAIYVIASNTATVLTLAGTGTAAIGSTYTIVDSGTVITALTAAEAGGPFGISNDTGAGIRIIGNESYGNFGNNIAVSKLSCAMSASSGQCVQVDGPTRAYVRWLSAAGAGQFAIGVRFTNQGGGFVNNSSFALSGSGSLGVSMGNIADQSGGVRISNSLFNGGAGGVQMQATGVTISGSKFFAQTAQAIVGAQLGTGGTQLSNNRIDCNSVGGARGISVTTHADLGGAYVVPIGLSSSDISNCMDAVRLAYPGAHGMFKAVSGTGNTVAFNVSYGANCLVDATSTITGATEINLDGAGSTIAAMRAAVPRLVTNTYGSIVYE
jgi:hypothetical protein